MWAGIQETIYALVLALSSVDVKGIVKEKAEDIFALRNVLAQVDAALAVVQAAVADGVVTEEEAQAAQSAVVTIKEGAADLLAEVKDWKAA